MKKLLALLLFVPVIVSATPDKGTLFSSAPVKAGLNAAPVKNEETGLNYFENAVENQVINNSVWYETPKFKKTVLDLPWESFASYATAKETMIKVLNEELRYEHTDSNALYTSASGFGEIFNGNTYYKTYFEPNTTSWMKLDQTNQAINEDGINKYDFQEGHRYLIHWLSNYSSKNGAVGNKVYVFVEKQVYPSTIYNPDYESQINKFISDQAENLIHEETAFKSDWTGYNSPSPAFSDPDLAPEQNPVFSDLRVVSSSEAGNIVSKDGQYYSYSHYNEYNGFDTAPDYNVPETTLLTARDLWSLTNKINEDGTRDYRHYICKQDNAEIRRTNWQSLIVAKSENPEDKIFTDSTFKAIVGGLEGQTLSLRKGYKTGDIKIHFYTNDKIWTKIKVEHTDFTEIVDEYSLSNSCNWEYDDHNKLELKNFDDNYYDLPAINAKYTFYSINSLGEFNSFSFNIVGADPDKGQIVFLGDSDQKDLGLIPDTTSSFNLKVRIENDRLSQNKFKIKEGSLKGSLEVGAPVPINANTGMCFPVTVKKFDTNHFASFTIQYESVETTCVYYLYKTLNNTSNVLKDVLKFNNKYYPSDISFKEDKRVEAKYNANCVVPNDITVSETIGGRVCSLKTKNIISKGDQDYAEKANVSYPVGTYNDNSYKISYELKEGGNVITATDERTFVVTIDSEVSFTYNGQSAKGAYEILSYKWEDIKEGAPKTKDFVITTEQLGTLDINNLTIEHDERIDVVSSALSANSFKVSIAPTLWLDKHSQEVPFKVIYTFDAEGEPVTVVKDDLSLFFCIEDGEDVYNVIEERGLTNCFSAAEELNTDGWQNEERTITGKGLVTFTVPEGGKTADGMQYSYRAYYKNNIGVETEIENSRSFEPSDNEYEIIIKQEFIDKNNASHVCEGKFFIKVDEATQPVPPGPGPTPTPGGGGGLSAGVLGGIIGGVVGLLAIVVVIIIVRIRKKQSLKKR